MITAGILSLNHKASTAADFDPANYQFSNEPAWIEPVEVSQDNASLPDGVQDGLFYLLVDRQKKTNPKAGFETEHFTHYSYLISNQEGLDSGSSITVNFDPIYESLKFHKLIVWRDGIAQARTESASYQILKSEHEKDNFSYNGELTLDIVLSDTRVGDVIEYSYSVIGSNPVYLGLREYGFKLNWSVPVKRVLYRIITPLQSPYRQRSNSKDRLFQTTKTGDSLEYRYERTNIEPNSSDEVDRVVISDIVEWEQIVDWSLPLYHAALADQSEVEPIAEQIRQKYLSTEARIGAALRWTQTNIRYLGIEYGTNSHNPSPASETLLRRYGDCKDKAVLLIAILQQLGISAEPALVNSKGHRPPNKSLYRLHAFNHVIVHIDLDGTEHWIDPTENHQKGALGQFTESDHDHALTIKKGQNKLTAMAPSNSGLLNITKKINITEEGLATMQVRTERTFEEAQTHRRNLSRDSVRSFGKNYFEYYGKYFDQLERIGGLSVEDRPNNSIITTENYQFPFGLNSTDTNYEAYARPDDITSILFDLEDASSTDEFQFGDHRSIEETIEIQYDSEIELFDEHIQIDNDYFSFDFTQTSNTESKLVILEYKFKVKQETIPIDYIKSVSKDADKAIDQSYFYLNNAAPDDTESALGLLATLTKKWSQTISIIVISSIALIYLYAFLEWQLDRRKPRPSGVFHPVSTKKFWLMSLSTLGVYSVYYLYSTFRYSRDNMQKKIWPAIRSVFSMLFLYSAYKFVREYSEGQENVKSISTWVVVLLCLLYFILNLINSNFLPVTLSILTVACLYPLHLCVNKLQGENNELYAYNSRIRPRHIFLLIISPFLLLQLIAEELNVIPSNDIVAEWQIWGFQRDFFERHSILDSKESVQYFYSDSIYDFRLDGNGLSDKQLFSYWASDDGTLKHTELNLDNISSIKVSNNADTLWDDGWIKAVSSDGTEITLNLPDIEKCKAPFIVKLRASVPSSTSFSCKT